MKVGIISDSHGALDDFKRVMAQLEDADRIIHLGDVLYHGPRNPIPEDYDPAGLAELIKNDDRFLIVKGNCDSEVDAQVTGKDISELEMLIQLGDNTFYLHHGHRFSIDDMVKRSRDYGANIVLFGHSHKKMLTGKGNTLIMNPGSLSLPKDGSKSYGVYEDGMVKLYTIDGRLHTLD